MLMLLGSGNLHLWLVRDYPSGDTVCALREATASQGAFPDYANSPTCIQKLGLVALITFHIQAKFLCPEVGPSSWRGCVSAPFVPVPKATMNLDDDLPFRQHNIRPPRKSPVMQAESEAFSMQHLAQLDLRLRILAADPGHHSGPGFLVHYIGHVVTALASRTWYVSSIAQFLRSRTCLQPMA